MKTTLLRRIVEVIQDGGTSGIKRGRLIQRLRVQAAQLDANLAFLQAENYITVQEMEGAWQQRGYIRYLFNPHAIDALDDLPEQLPADFTAAYSNALGLPNKHKRVHHNNTNCQLCGKKLAAQQGGGRPRKFCDAECRGNYFRETSTQTGGILHRAEPRTRHRVAYYLVAANLISRGGISFPPDGCPLGRIIFGSKLVDVVVANSSDPSDYYTGSTGSDIKAVVTLDGRIRYEPPFPDDLDAEKEAAPIDDESTGA